MRAESHRRQARKRVREALRLGRKKHPNYLAVAHIAAGELAVLEGRRETAARHFDAASSVSNRQGAGLWAAEAQRGRAIALGGEAP